MNINLKNHLWALLMATSACAYAQDFRAVDASGETARVPVAAMPAGKESGQPGKKAALKAELTALDRKLAELNAKVGDMQAALAARRDKPGAELRTKAASEPMTQAQLLPASGAVVLLLSATGAILYRRRRSDQKSGKSDDPATGSRRLQGDRRSRRQHGNPVSPAPRKIPLPGAALEYERSGGNALPERAASADRRSFRINDARDAEDLAVDALLEEAELYAIHGRPGKASEILSGIISGLPSKIEAWLLLLSLFCNRKNARKFESVAREFLSRVNCSETWQDIQDAGRKIDPGNPLYLRAERGGVPRERRNSGQIRRRLLGEILVDMKAVLLRDLEDSFARLQGGRIGNHLISCGLITPAQLERSLKLQACGAESEPVTAHAGFEAERPVRCAGGPRSISDTLIEMGVVTEQELDYALAGFDPARHGHCGGYLERCGLISKKQLRVALLAQLSGATDPSFVAFGNGLENRQAAETREAFPEASAPLRI